MGLYTYRLFVASILFTKLPFYSFYLLVCVFYSTVHCLESFFKKHINYTQVLLSKHKCHPVKMQLKLSILIIFDITADTFVSSTVVKLEST